MNSTAIPLPNRKAISSWPSSRLLELAEAHAGDRDLLEFIQTELGRRDFEAAHTAARRVTELLSAANGAKAFNGGNGANGHAAEAVAPGSDGAPDARIAAMQSRIEALEQRAREAEMRANAAERALALESLPVRGQGLLRRVHLADTAPSWLVDAARRAFRLRFHPDRFADPVMKARAEETFKEAEEVFRQITSGH